MGGGGLQGSIPTMLDAATYTCKKIVLKILCWLSSSAKKILNFNTKIYNMKILQHKYFPIAQVCHHVCV